MSSREDFEKWFLSEQGKPYDGMYCFAKAAWMAATERAAKVCAGIFTRVVLRLMDRKKGEPVRTFKGKAVAPRIAQTLSAKGTSDARQSELCATWV